MEVVLNIKAPQKGEVYVSKVHGQQLIFQLIDVKDVKNEDTNVVSVTKRKPGEYPGFGFASKKISVSEKDIAKAKKSLFRDIKV